VEAGYEDVWYYLWRERRLPVNVDPFDARLDDEQERDRLRHVFQRGLDAVVGYALPLAPDEARGGWRSTVWPLRGDRLYLLPGDSPMGYRLPLDSLPWAAADDVAASVVRDPTAAAPLLAAYDELRARAEPLLRLPHARGDATPVAADATPARFVSAEGTVRTALCVEPRRGILCVFMPPIEALDPYLELVAAIEATAGALSLPVMLDGYPPPADPRLRQFMITPDPGVIEVNVQPAESWSELVQQTTALYEDARETGLTTEKFMLDGRHTGTGGGNHFVLGGALPSDSPFLRRPDLLKSLLGYWHNHPALSYL